MYEYMRRETEILVQFGVLCGCGNLNFVFFGQMSSNMGLKAMKY